MPIPKSQNHMVAMIDFLTLVHASHVVLAWNFSQNFITLKEYSFRPVSRISILLNILQKNKHLSLNTILERLLQSFGGLIIITQAQGYNQLKSILNANQTITVKVKCAG